MLRFGLIGAGRWGKVYIRTIEKLGSRIHLTHLATSRPENKALLKEPARLFSDWKKLLASDCDAVIVAAPAPQHAEIASACLKAGKPVIVEKPLCSKAKTAEVLLKQAKKARLPMLINYVQLYNPAYRAIKQAVAQAGNPVRVIFSEGMDLGPFRPDTGTLWDRAPHDVSICLDLLGKAGAKTKVKVLGALPDKKGRPEMLSIRLEWSRGPSAWIHAGRLSPNKRRTLAVITDTNLFHFDDQVEVRCRQVPFDYKSRMEMGSAPWPKEGDPIPVPEGTAMEQMLLSFADQVEHKKPPLVDPALTLELTRILEQCEKQLE